MSITLHIERLVLDGISVGLGQRDAVRSAVEAELTRLLAEGGLSPALTAGGAVPHLPGGALTLTPGGAPAALGAQIARSVYGSLGKP